MQKDIGELNYDCLQQIFLYLPPADLLNVASVCKKWAYSAQMTWPAVRTLKIKNVPNRSCLERVVSKTKTNIATLSFEGCEDADDALDGTSECFPNVKRIKLDGGMVVTDREEIHMLKNYQIADRFMSKDNIIKALRLAAITRLYSLTIKAVLRAFKLQVAGLLHYQQVLDLLEELPEPGNIHLKHYYIHATQETLMSFIEKKLK